MYVSSHHWAMDTQKVWGQSTPWGPWRPKADILECVGGGAPHDKCQGVWWGGSPPHSGALFGPSKGLLSLCLSLSEAFGHMPLTLGTPFGPIWAPIWHFWVKYKVKLIWDYFRNAYG